MKPKFLILAAEVLITVVLTTAIEPEHVVKYLKQHKTNRSTTINSSRNFVNHLTQSHCLAAVCRAPDVLLLNVAALGNGGDQPLRSGRS